MKSPTGWNADRARGRRLHRLIARISEERELELMSFAARETKDSTGATTANPLTGPKKTPAT
jgi:hypothetical protein